MLFDRAAVGIAQADSGDLKISAYQPEVCRNDRHFPKPVEPEHLARAVATLAGRVASIRQTVLNRT